MKGLLLYFSGTGNTKFIAKRIQRDFFDKDYFITLQSIEENKKIDLDKYDFLILGSPKYYEYIPLFFLEWVEQNLPSSIKSLKTIAFCTGVAPTSTSFKKLEKILIKKNCNLIMTRTFQMPNNYLIGMYKPTSEEKCKLYSISSSSNASKLVNNFIDKNYCIEKISPFIGSICKNISANYCKSVHTKSKNFSVNANCTNCQKCIDNCPTQNIYFDNGKILFKDKCILCTRCINICPNNAICYKNKVIPQYTHHINQLNFK